VDKTKQLDKRLLQLWQPRSWMVKHKLHAMNSKGIWYNKNTLNHFGSL